jgi:hypothetical protein
MEIEITTKHRFGSATRTVYWDKEKNTIRVDKHTFTWAHYFEVNELV